MPKSLTFAIRFSPCTNITRHFRRKYKFHLTFKFHWVSTVQTSSRCRQYHHVEKLSDALTGRRSRIPRASLSGVSQADDQALHNCRREKRNHSSITDANRCEAAIMRIALFLYSRIDCRTRKIFKRHSRDVGLSINLRSAARPSRECRLSGRLLIEPEIFTGAFANIYRAIAN